MDSIFHSMTWHKLLLVPLCLVCTACHQTPPGANQLSYYSVPVITGSQLDEMNTFLAKRPIFVSPINSVDGNFVLPSTLFIDKNKTILSTNSSTHTRFYKKSFSEVCNAITAARFDILDDGDFKKQKSACSAELSSIIFESKYASIELYQKGDLNTVGVHITTKKDVAVDVSKEMLESVLWHDIETRISHS